MYGMKLSPKGVIGNVPPSYELPGFKIIASNVAVRSRTGISAAGQIVYTCNGIISPYSERENMSVCVCACGRDETKFSSSLSEVGW